MSETAHTLNLIINISLIFYALILIFTPLKKSNWVIALLVINALLGVIAG